MDDTDKNLDLSQKCGEFNSCFIKQEISDNEPIDFMVIKIEPEEIESQNIKTEISEPIDPLSTDYFVHERIENFKCVLCSKNFSSKRNLNNHISSVHEGLKNHKCETCGKAFSQLHHLKGHIRSVHQGTIHKLRRHKRQDSSSKDDVG